MKQSKKMLSILLTLILIFNLLSPISIVAADTPSQGLQFTLSSSRTSYIVSGIGTCTDTDIVIPSQYNDLPVTGIGNSAFSYCSNLTSITIPEGVTSIGTWAFEYCSSLTSINISETVTSIDTYALFGCSALTGIEVSPENPNYCSKDGVLFSKDMSSLIHYPVGNSRESYSIPEGVTSICAQAFRDCTSLTDITIPESVTGIGWDAFRDCSNLTSVTIPKEVTSIGEAAFYGCSALADVYYSGTKAQWDEINIYSKNKCLQNATIHYTQCDHCYEEETVPATCTEAGSITYTCSLCSDSYTEELPALGHSYADGFCTRCGVEDPEREKKVAEPEEAQFVVGAATGKAGDEITVSVSIANNPGIVSAYLQLYYDTSKLELVSAEDAELLKDGTFGSILSNMPYSLNWDDSLSSENNTANGVIANLTFRIKEDCEPGEAAITLHYDPYSVLDTNLDPVSFAISDGAVRVVDYYAGDADGDNLITARDVVVLRRYLAGDHSITLSESAADCDGIPGINARDVAYLRRNLAHWEGYELQYPQ